MKGISNMHRVYLITSDILQSILLEQPPLLAKPQPFILLAHAIATQPQPTEVVFALNICILQIPTMPSKAKTNTSLLKSSTIQILTPDCRGPRFCLFLKFGQEIVIRVLMLNF